MALSIRKKFIALGAVLVVTSSVMGGFIYQNLQLSEQGRVATVVIQRHMDADMKHDNIRGNVYKALLAAKTSDPDLLRSAQGEVEAMSAEFVEDIEENLAADVPEHIRDKFKSVKQVLGGYLTAGSKIANSAATDYDAANAIMPEFEKAFSDLEAEQKKVSDAMLKWSSDIEVDSKLVASYLQASLALLLLIAVVVPVFAIFSIFKPLSAMIGAMNGLIAGDTSIEIPHTERGNEMGEIARALQVFKDDSLKISRFTEEQRVKDIQSSEERRKARLELAKSFEDNVKGVVDMVASAATEMDATSKSVSSIAESSKSKLSVLSTQISSTSNNVKVVSGATGELSSAITEISGQIAKAANITSGAVEDAKEADGTAHILSEASSKIGEVIGIINSIASQINLLALNATIEAARAGEAGKGFAVVASEVKNLAGQTTKATDEISQFVLSIQNSTARTVDVIKQISDKIYQINTIAGTIASAVEEQGAATREIANNVNQAAGSSEQVAKNTVEVSKALNDTSDASVQMMAASGELARSSEKLRSEVNNFLANVRVA